MRQFNMKSILPQVIREGSWIQNALRREEPIQIRFAEEINRKNLIVFAEMYDWLLFSLITIFANIGQCQKQTNQIACIIIAECKQ